MRRTPLKRTGGLKRTQSRRQLKPAEIEDLKRVVEARDRGVCIGLRAGIPHRCTAPYDPEHLVEQQAIRRVCGEGSDALTDPRLAAFACRYINGALFSHEPLRLAVEPKSTSNDEADEHARRSIRRKAPKGFEEAVIEYGLEVEADRKLGAL